MPDGTSDVHYTFGAWWRIVFNGVEVLNTSAHPLFDTASGAHIRGYVPAMAHTTTYDLAVGV